MPGRTQQALVYTIATDEPREILEVIAPFKNLVRWDIAPAIETSEALPAALFPEEHPPGSPLVP